MFLRDCNRGLAHHGRSGPEETSTVYCLGTNLKRHTLPPRAIHSWWSTLLSVNVDSTSGSSSTGGSVSGGATVILREEFMEPIGLSAYALAKALGVPLPRVNDIVREKRWT